MSRISCNYLLPFFIVTIFLCQNVFAMPPVQLIKSGSGEAYSIQKHGVITFPQSAKNLKVAADWLRDKLNELNGYHWSVNATKSAAQPNGDIEIDKLMNSHDIPYSNTDKRYFESYVIKVGKLIKLSVGGRAGSLYGVQTLFRMISHNQLIESSKIIDYPDYKWRGVYITLNNTTCGDPYTLKGQKKEKWLVCFKSLIDSWRLLRINSLYIQTPVFFRLDGNDIKLFDDVFTYARLNNVEPIPVLASKLWGIPLDFLRKDAIEGIYHKDVKFKVEAGYLVPQNNSITSHIAYDWEIKHNLLSPDWHTINKADNERETVITIKQEVNNEPWKNPVFVKDKAGNTRLSVQPGQYYELMISARSDKNNAARILVTATGYNKNGDALSNIHQFSAAVFAKQNWSKRWIPVFASKKAHSISIRVVARNISSKAVSVELRKPVLIPMENKFVNVLDNNETTLLIKSSNGKQQYTNGKDYSFSHEAIREWRETDFKNIKKTVIKILPGSRIHNGQIVNVSFDSLPLEYRAIPMSKYSAASDYTYKEYQRVFKRLKSLSPKFIHISMDEHAGGLNRDSRSKKLRLCNRDLYIHYINTLDDILHKKGNVTLPQGGRINGVGLSDTKLIMWDDMLNPWHNGNNLTYQLPFGGVTGATALNANRDCDNNITLNHDVLLADWWYKGNDKRGVVKNSPSFYSGLGYQYFVSTWYQPKGIKNWLKRVSPSKTEGFIATTWNRQLQGVPDMACMAWNRLAYKKCLQVK